MPRGLNRLGLFAAAGLFGPALCAAAPATAEQVEFFEKQVRPVLAEKCYQCHSTATKTPFAGLYLDSRAGAMKGSDAGPVIVPGEPEKSRLIQALEGKTPVPMPPTGPLSDDTIATLKDWIRMGAPWPDDEAPAPAPTASEFDLEDRRDSHWAWRPVKAVEPPPVQDESWPLQPPDRFLLAKLEDKGLDPAPPADRATLLRRLSFDLTGLPPTPREVEAFVNDSSPDAYGRVVDRLLGSPHFGERWARHWMDLVRYAESHGSEGDPDLLEAWRYRDYLIRALNGDVPYDQLIREHLAGDLLPEPRINREEQINESIAGAAHLRMVEHGFQPVDPWEDRVKWTDNQIDVFSKAFQGLTVSCARCHDHKFDAISQKDFYALFGVFKGARPIQATIDDPQYLLKHSERLRGLKKDIKARLGESWARAAQTFEPPAEPPSPAAEEPEKETGEKAEDASGKVEKQEHKSEDEPDSSPLAPWFALKDIDAAAFPAAWRELAGRWKKEAADRRQFNEANFEAVWDVSRPDDYQQWLKHGVGLPARPSPPGEFSMPPGGAEVISGVYEGGVYTHRLSRKHNGILQSPRFKIETDAISLRLLGGNFATARLMIENYAVPRAGIYHLRYSAKSDQPRWVTWDTTYWKGFTAYIEFATLDDLTNFIHDPEDSKKKPRPTPVRDGRSYFGAGRVWFHNDKEITPKEENLPILHLLRGEAPASREELLARYRKLLAEAVESWRAGRLDYTQAAFLDYFVRHGLLPNTLAELPAVKELVAEYRRLEEEVPVPRRAPGVLEEGPPPQELLIRGNHKNFGDPVMQRYLTALDCETFENPRIARLRLAEEVASAENPLTARVMVNRIWFHLFGRGIVATVDNFGKLGKPPSHPELLDWLAHRFVEDGWSIKSMIRMLVTSRAYQMSSKPPAEAAEIDPENILLRHMPIRRLEAEAIRDAMLAVSGRLDRKMFGPSINVYYAYAKGKTKGDKDKGPLDGGGRRSIYQEIRRNAHNPFLEVFDLPKPASTRGERDVTNVPAQSLTLLNSPFVIGQAEEWAERLIQQDEANAGERVRRMFLKAFGRLPDADELDRSQTFLASLAAEHGVAPANVLESPEVWRDFAQTLFNFKEFIYIR